MKDQKYYFLTRFVSAILFGFATPMSKILLTTLNPFLLAGLLYIGASIGLSPFFLKTKENIPRGQILHILRQFKKERLNVIGSLFFGGVFGPLFLLFGLSNINAGSVSIWLNFELVATAILGRLFFKRFIGQKRDFGDSLHVRGRFYHHI